MDLVFQRNPVLEKLRNNSDAKKKAEELGYKETNEQVKGQKVFKNGNKYIVRDIDQHNVGAWNMADSVKNLGSKSTRMRTYDINLNRIGD